MRLSRKQLLVCSDAVKDCRITPNTIDQQEIRSEMTLRHAGPVCAAFVEAMFPKWLRQSAAGNHEIENVLKSLGFEFRVLSCGTIVALEAWQDY